MHELTPPGRLDCAVLQPIVGFLAVCTFETESKSFTEGPKELETISDAFFSVLSMFGTVLDVRNVLSSVEITVLFSYKSKFSCCLKKSGSFVSSGTISVLSSKCSCKKNHNI